MSRRGTDFMTLLLLAVIAASFYGFSEVTDMLPTAFAGGDESSGVQETIGNSPAMVRNASGEPGITVLGSAPTTVQEATLFSFDDISIPHSTNLFLKMAKPEKHPDNPLIPLGKPGAPDEWSVQCYGSVIHHEGKYKLWYIALNERDLTKMPEDVHYRGAQLAYAESEDGIHWVRPNLGLVEFRGNKDNNLLFIDPPQAHGLDCLVLFEPEDPDPEKRFKMLLHMGARFDGKPAGAPVPFFSTDGMRWHIAVDAKLENYTVASDETVLPPEHFEMGGLYK